MAMSKMWKLWKILSFRDDYEAKRGYVNYDVTYFFNLGQQWKIKQIKETKRKAEIKNRIVVNAIVGAEVRQ